MQLIFLTFLTMFAFAGNSILNRLALASGAIDAGDFAAIRLLSGAVILLLIARVRKESFPKREALSAKMAAALLVYMLGFSYAYIQLDAGLGALILFGGVQLTMLIGLYLKGERLLPLQMLGGAIAFIGLIVLFLPSELNLPITSGLLMCAAAVGWGIYSLLGKQARAPLPATALNFTLAFPFALVLALIIPNETALSARGVLLAVASGAITSGLGYALWYSILPKLNSALAATVQLSVPIIAMAMGVAFLGESLTLRATSSALLVMLGIGLSIWASSRKSRA